MTRAEFIEQYSAMTLADMVEVGPRGALRHFESISLEERNWVRRLRWPEGHPLNGQYVFGADNAAFDVYASFV